MTVRPCRSSRAGIGQRLGTPRLLAPALALVGVIVGGCMPTPESSQGKQISDLYTVFLVVGIIVAAIVWGLVTWSVLRYRRRDDRLPAQTTGDLRMEILWTLLPLLTVLALFVLTVQTISSVGTVEAGGVNLHVTAFRWQWSATYPNAGVKVTGTDAANLEIVLPVDTPIHITLDSLDVNHAFFVPAFLFKRDAIPGSPTTFDIRVTAPGVYPGQCAELCGIGHSRMLFTIRAVDMPTFKAWLADHAAGGSAAP